jgi:hypothetical protein
VSRPIDCAFCGQKLRVSRLRTHIGNHSNSELGSKWLKLSDREQGFYGKRLTPDQMVHIQGVLLDSIEAGKV